MPEDAGKKRFIKDFLQQVKRGEGFVEDIWIERVVRLPGSEGEGSTASSLSKRPISNITQLLEDDLRHTFDDGYFTFRFVAALMGSGKTSVLAYLQELTKTKRTYENHAVVVKFKLSDPLSVNVSQSFSIKLYCHLLAQTFWELIHNKHLSSSVRSVAEDILSEFLDDSQVDKLKRATQLVSFRSKFNIFFAAIGVGFEELFFEVISQVSAKDPRFTFVYLTDELDGLQKFPNEIQETRALFKALIKSACQHFQEKIRLLIYLVGTSDNVGGFIAGDSVLESLVKDSVINLNKGYSNEFELIRRKINDRIQGAYKGYKEFDKAWREIQDLALKPANNLRDFCQEYAGAVLKIHETYFEEAPEQVFEGNARELVEAKCKQKWASFLNKTAYKLSVAPTTTMVEDHAFDCYVELRHNGNCVARAFGEAKNYELLSGHLETFKQWLEDVKFKPSNSDGNPPDLAFMIGPSCPSLLERKLELEKIEFIKADKVIAPTPTATTTQTPAPTPAPPPRLTPAPPPTAVNINTASKDELIKAFRGTGIKQATVDKLINYRQHKQYGNLDDLASYLKSNPSVQAKIKKKLDEGEICF
jgi:hypothetical protein